MQTIIIYLKLMFTLEQSVNKNSIVQIDFVHFSCLKKMYLKIKIKKLIRIVPKVVLRLTGNTEGAHVLLSLLALHRPT